MQIFPPAAHESQKSVAPRISSRHRGVTAFVALGALLCSGAASPTACKSSGSLGPTTGEVVGVAVAAGAVIATVVLVEVNHSHHTLKGCVSSGPNGLQLQTGESKTYSLDDNAATIKPGDRVKIHGSRVKKTKDQNGSQVFKVEKLNKDYGPCKVLPASTSPSTR